MSGVSTRHIASLTRKAEKKPETRVTAASSRSGCRARIVIELLTRRKNPESRTLATTIIMPSNSASVSISIARYASSSESRPVAAIRLPPRRAAPARVEMEAGQLADRDDGVGADKDQNGRHDDHVLAPRDGGLRKPAYRSGGEQKGAADPECELDRSSATSVLRPDR